MATIEAARPMVGERIELFDTDARGLSLRVSRATKTWVFRYRSVDGRQPRIVLGEYPGMRLDQARDLAHAMRSQVKAGGDPQADKRRRAVEARAAKLHTVGLLFEAYMVACASGDYRPRRKVKRATTIRGEVNVWNYNLAKPLGDLPIEALDRNLIRNLLRTIKARAPIQANHCYRLLTRIFNFAIWDERMIVSPMRGVDIPSVETPRSRVLSEVEIRTVWAGLSEGGPRAAIRNGKPSNAILAGQLRSPCSLRL